jgi:hypothetical protein
MGVSRRHDCLPRNLSVRGSAPVRGFQHNVSELKTWFQGMVGSSSKGFGQRAEQNWSWVNQSIIAVTHRLTRPVNYNQDNPAKPPQYMNLVDLDFKTANWIVLAVSLAIGLGYVAVMPARSRTTPRSNAEELGILFCLMTVASPLARQYYFLWLFFPMTILMHRAAYDQRHAVRAVTWAVLAVAGSLMCLSFRFFRRICRPRQQPRCRRRDRGRIGLAHPASACGRHCLLLVSGGWRATT